MKLIHTILLGICFFSSFKVISQCPSISIMSIEDITCENNVTNLVFEDNFDNNQLDEKKWRIPYQGVIRGFSFNDEKQWYVNTSCSPCIPIENNVTINNGSLKIITREEQVTGSYIDWDLPTPTTVSNTFNYTSGQIESKYKFGYGFYEIRSKVPKGKGFWPAFWLYNGYKESEIDIFEFWNEDNIWGNYSPDLLSTKVNTNIHYQYEQGENEMCELKVGQGTDYSADFHVFTLEWDFFHIKWYIDGQLERELYRYYNLNGQGVTCSMFEPFVSYQKLLNFPEPENYNVLFNTAVSVSGGLPDEDTPFPSYFEIDYFRYWKNEICEGSLVANNLSDLNISDDVYNIKIKENITLQNDIFIDNKQLDLKANNSISLKPGIHVKGNFNAWIASCNQYKSSLSNEIYSDQITSIDNKSIQNPSIQKVELNEKPNLTIYPNPFTDLLKIDITEPSTFKLTISDTRGSIINEFKFENEKSVTMDLSELTVGVYIILIEGVENIEKNKFKIIKN